MFFSSSFNTGLELHDTYDICIQMCVVLANMTFSACLSTSRQNSLMFNPESNKHCFASNLQK